LIDGIRYGVEAVRDYRKNSKYVFNLLAMIGNFAVIAVILFTKKFGVEWTIALAGAWRIFGTAVSIYHSKEGRPESTGEDVIKSLGLSDTPSVHNAVSKIEKEESESYPTDKKWIFVFLLLLFIIHLGRMGFDKTSLRV
jgi:hypothetical protein